MRKSGTYGRDFGRKGQGKFVVTRFNNIPQHVNAAREGMKESLKEAAFEIENRTKENIRKVDAIDTGNLLNSVYVSIPGDDRRPQKLAVSGEFFSVKQNRNVKVKADNLGERTPLPSGNQITVGVAAAYGIYVEFGTRRMAARPYFFPAVESVRGDMREIGTRWVRRKVEGA